MRRPRHIVDVQRRHAPSPQFPKTNRAETHATLAVTRFEHPKPALQPAAELASKSVAGGSGWRRLTGRHLSMAIAGVLVIVIIVTGHGKRNVNQGQ